MARVDGGLETIWIRLEEIVDDVGKVDEFGVDPVEQVVVDVSECQRYHVGRIEPPEGRTLTQERNEPADLFWVIRGGGGNFGIVSTSGGPLPVRSNAISVTSTDMTTFISCIPLFAQ